MKSLQESLNEALDISTLELLLDNELLLEELISSSGLNAMRFEKIDFNEANAITSEWNEKGTNKWKMNADDKDWFKNALYAEYSDYYKIMLKDNILGVFGVLKYRDHYAELAKKLDKGFNTVDNLGMLLRGTRIRALMLNSVFKKYKTFTFDELHDSDIKPTDSAEEICDAVEKKIDMIRSKMADISLWYMNPEKDKNISVVAVVKVFYRKLIEMMKNDGIKYLTCDPKDERIKKMYIKLGQFEEIDKKMFEDEDLLSYDRRLMSNIEYVTDYGLRVWDMLIRKI